ncbi:MULTISPECIES: ion transporter [unclassified Thioalkalivibrio]|uniref:ion transporter n=1 Tax=unclassified Thioalkalivibrio TaxID=2621013 RepID=UPI0003755D73|nr:MULTISPECIES: ion transporter [unclassified Thioalkalivibrio]
MRLKLESALEESLSNYLTAAVIIAAILTAPLTITYWLDVEHPLITVADWLIWAVFVVEYAFYMAISHDRWKTTKENWLSVLIIIFSFPLLHEILKSTRLIRLLRPLPLLRHTALLRQIELFRLASVRNAGSSAAITEAKEKLGKEHWAVRFIVRVEYYRSRLVTGLLKLLPFIKSSTIRKRRQEERSKREDMNE